MKWWIKQGCCPIETAMSFRRINKESLVIPTHYPQQKSNLSHTYILSSTVGSCQQKVLEKVTNGNIFLSKRVLVGAEESVVIKPSAKTIHLINYLRPKGEKSWYC